MVTLINQLENDIQNLFSSREDEYKSVIVKQKYKELPKGQYPKVIIEEIENSEVESRSTSTGEKTTALGYQITVYSRDMQTYDAIDSVRFMLDIIGDYLTPPKYNMTRVGTIATMPFISDSTIMTASIRYTCVYDAETNLIYKK